jgi:hypothetical protein
MDYELRLCALEGNLERVRQLVEGGANIEETDNSDQTAMSVASLHGCFAIVVYLVEHGANVARADHEGNTALHCASMGGDLSTVKYLLKHGATVTQRNAFGSTALLHAAENGNLRWSNVCFLSREVQASLRLTIKETLRSWLQHVVLVIQQRSNGFSSMEVLRSATQISREGRCGLSEAMMTCQICSKVHT